MSSSQKDLLLRQTRDAFGAQDEMSLKAALRRISTEEASWSPGPGISTVEELVVHIADCKMLYLNQGFGTPDIQVQGPGIAAAIDYLERVQTQLEQALTNCSEAALQRPIPTRCHGESAAHFFWIMAMHDVWHGGQVRTRRTLFSSCRKVKAVTV